MRLLPLLALLLAGAGAVSSRPLDRHAWADACEERSRSYVVETNTFPELGRSLADTLQQAYAYYEDRFGPLEGTARRPMRIALFRTEEEYLREGGGVVGAVGHFDSTLDRCAFVWRGETGDRGWPIAVHEACHHYFRRRFPDLAPPTWYSEGIACLFEGLRDPGTTKGVSRVRIVAAKAALEAGDAKLDLLLSARAQVRANRLVLSNFSPSRYYALSWSLCHFLATDPGTREGFRRFELRLFASRPSFSAREAHARALLEEECGELADLERRWREHLSALPLPEEAPAAPVYGWELTSERAFVRWAALRRTEEGAVPDVLRPAVVSLLRDPDLVARTEAARLLAPQMGADAVPAMVEALDLGDAQLKALALVSLAHPDAHAAVPRLLAEGTMREEALEALAAIRDARSFPALRDAVNDRLLPSRVRARCAAALRGDPAAVPALAVAAGDHDRAVRTAAQAALIALGADPGNALGTLGRRMREAASAAEAAVERAAMQREGAPAGREEDLMGLLIDLSASPEARSRACLLLSLDGCEAAIPRLKRLCRPGGPDLVRFAAARALVRLTGETRGFREGQPASEREASLRAWAECE